MAIPSPSQADNRFFQATPKGVVFPTPFSAAFSWTFASDEVIVSADIQLRIYNW
jgi:hypothetical protein